MTTTVLTPSGLKTSDVGDTTWGAADTDNWNKMNNDLLKLTAILDVDAAGISDGDVLKYSSGDTEWKAHTPPYPALATTTTTTTTSTTTTTTTTTI